MGCTYHGVIPQAKIGGRRKGVWRQGPLNISETVRDRGLVPKNHQLENDLWESNGHVADDVTWPERSNRWFQYA